MIIVDNPSLMAIGIEYVGCHEKLRLSELSRIFIGKVKIYLNFSDGNKWKLDYPNFYSARALVKKTQDPGIKLQKADFFRNDTWTSPQTNSEDAPKIPLVHFFNSRWPPPCNAIFKKTGVYPNSSPL